MSDSRSRMIALEDNRNNRRTCTSRDIQSAFRKATARARQSGDRLRKKKGNSRVSRSQNGAALVNGYGSRCADQRNSTGAVGARSLSRIFLSRHLSAPLLVSRKRNFAAGFTRFYQRGFHNASTRAAAEIVLRFWSKRCTRDTQVFVRDL